MYPILEFDPETEAFIEPSKVIRRRDMPEHCVICFFKEVIQKVAAVHDAKVIVENRWEDGPHPVYEIGYRDQRLAFFHPGIGAPLAGALLEEVIAIGCRKFVACGGCGVLDPSIAFGKLVIVTEALRDEGLSYHYKPPAESIGADKSGVAALMETLERHGYPYTLAKTWTTDAPYRETPGNIHRRRAQGCAVVEMEAAGLIAVAEYRKVLFGQILYAGDDLSGPEWDHRSWQKRADIRENLFWLAAEACLFL